MSEFIWKKDGAGSGPGEDVMRFLAGEDVVLDRELIAFDIQASKAHVNGLARIGLLTPEEAGALSDGLDRIGEHLRAGELVLDDRFEAGSKRLRLLTSRTSIIRKETGDSLDGILKIPDCRV